MKNSLGKAESMEKIKEQGLSKKRQHRRTIIYIVLPWIIIVVNVLLLIYIAAQIRRLDDVLDSVHAAEQNSIGTNTGDAGEDEGLSVNWAADRRTEGMGASGAGAEDYVAQVGLTEVDPPVKRNEAQVMARLEELADQDERITDILAQRESYPDKMLENLANNPEMTDFVANYFAKRGTGDGVLTDSEKDQDFPLFLQWDPRWGYLSYGDDSNIGLAGCGPTCLAMALYYLTRDESITPDHVADYSMENGYWASGKGTAWALLEDYPLLYGVSATDLEMDERYMKSELDQGHILIASMGAGDFALAGHFIVIYGYDAGGFLVNDPNCVARSNRSWSFGELWGQMKNIWTLQKGGHTFSHFCGIDTETFSTYECVSEEMKYSWIES